MSKCTIRKFTMPMDEAELERQMAFFGKLTELDTNGFGWPQSLATAKTADGYRTAMKRILAKEDYDLDDLRERGYVPQQYWWILNENGEYIGIAKLRYVLTPEMLRRGGHIGYGLAEEYRGKGYGTAGLKLLLEECKRNGLKDVLLTAFPNNFASRRIIEKNGGQLWDIIERDDGTKSVRYWICL